MATARSDSFYHRWVFLIILGAFLFRVLYSLFYPVHLAGDEAYYWEWGRRPALGYYSKPAMIAWIYGVVNWIGGGSLFSVRFTAILLGTLTLIVTYLLTRKLFDLRTAFLAVIVALAVPGNCLLNFVLTIDAPLVLAWSLSLFFLWKYSQGEQSALSLLCLFICIVIGHLSKQMMVAFPILAIAFLTTGKQTRPLLKRAGTWIVLLGSFVGWLPLLYWNSKNHWVTFKHMDSHLGARAEETIWATLYERIETFVEFVLSQIGALSPIIALLIFQLTVLMIFKKKKDISPNLRFLIIFCGVPLIGFLIFGLFQKMQPNWPAVAYLAGVPMVAAWFSIAIDWFAVSDKSRSNHFRIGIGLGFALGAFFYFGPMVFNAIGQEGHKADPNRRLIGSDRLASAVQEVRETIPDWENHFMTSSGHRYQTGWLGFELPDQPKVYRIAGNQIESQFEIWPGPWEDGQKGKNAIHIASGNLKVLSTNFTKAFDDVELIKHIEVKFGSGLREYSIFRCTNLKDQLRPDIKIE